MELGGHEPVHWRDASKCHAEALVTVGARQTAGAPTHAYTCLRQDGPPRKERFHVLLRPHPGRSP